MLKLLFFIAFLGAGFAKNERQHLMDESLAMINVVDLTKPTTWKQLNQYFTSVEKHWKVCINCGVPGLGTAMHLDFVGTPGVMHPAIIPVEYLVTRLSIIDVSSLTRLNPALILSLDVALQWITLKKDPKEPTLLLFKFGWREDPSEKRSCVCRIPGISYELAEWIAANLSHVVGVATDAPTLESEQTREFTRRTVTNLLGKSGVYMIENVNMKRKVPDGCMSIAMPLMMMYSNYVPTRLSAFCPATKTDKRVTIALKTAAATRAASRLYDVNLDEIMN